MPRNLIWLEVDTPGLGKHARVMDAASQAELTARNYKDGFPGPFAIVEAQTVGTFEEFVSELCGGVMPTKLEASNAKQLALALNTPPSCIYTLIPTEPVRLLAPGFRADKGCEFYQAKVAAMKPRLYVADLTASAP